MAFKISRSQRLTAVIGIASVFFVAEISVGFYTHSIALVADAFHYLNDLVGFVVALVALKVSEKNEWPKSLSFGWQRAQLLGAFFNGVLLFALGISVFLQSIERFVTLQRVDDPKLMLIMGSIGLGLNLVSAIFLHEHHHHDHGHHHHGDSRVPEIPMAIEGDNTHFDSSFCAHHTHKHQTQANRPVTHRHDLGMMGVLLHVIGDAINNIGVMAAALVIWLTHYEGRYYADPGTSMGIAIMIILSSIPLVRRSGHILLESAPDGVDPADVKHDLETIPGVLSVHELHIWRLNQQKTLASVHVVVSDPSVPHFLKLTKIINECFHAYGIHSATLQPEIAPPGEVIMVGQEAEKMETVAIETKMPEKCQIVCGELCTVLTCCG